MSFRHHWQLREDLDFMNHGSFGATPRVVLQKQREYQDALECDPIEYLAPERQLGPKLDRVRKCLARLLGGTAANFGFVRNATDGVNAVVRSFDFRQGDEVVVTSHGYNACINALRFAAERSGATVRVANIPFPISDPQQVIDAVEASCTAKTRLVLVDHVTSPTGLVFPVKQIIDNAHRDGIRVMVDGAHAPGMLKLDLDSLGADYYTANHHKWLCAPKTSGFLYVDPQWQDSVRSTIISHSENMPHPGRSKFMSRFDWGGTYDPTPLMCVVDSVDFLSGLFPGGTEELMQRNRTLALESRSLLCDVLGIDAPSPDDMIGSLVTLPLSDDWSAKLLSGKPGSGKPGSGISQIQRRFYQEHQFEFPVLNGQESDGVMIRISLQAYNDLEQVNRLADVLRNW